MKGATMGKADIPLVAVRELLDAQLEDRMSIDRDELDRQATAAHLGEDVDRAIRDLPPGEYTRMQLETRLLPSIEQRVQARMAGLGGGSSEPSGKKGSRQGRQQGRR